MAPDISIVVARSLNEAVAHLSAGGARVAAGGTELAASLQIDGPWTSKVVDISQIDDLKGFDRTPDGGLRIGALSTLAEVILHPTVRGAYAGLSQAALAAGQVDTRARATIGGNICQRPRCWFYRGGYDCARKGGGECFAVAGDNRYHCLFGGSTCLIVHPSDTATALSALGAYPPSNFPWYRAMSCGRACLPPVTR